jgi:hypothetical protein
MLSEDTHRENTFFTGSIILAFHSLFVVAIVPGSPIRGVTYSKGKLAKSTEKKKTHS